MSTFSVAEFHHYKAVVCTTMFAMHAECSNMVLVGTKVILLVLVSLTCRGLLPAHLTALLCSMITEVHNRLCRI